MEFDVFTAELTQVPALEPKRPIKWPAGRAAVRVAGKFEASMERVFDAWLDPSIAGKWLFAMASRPMTRVAIDARVGGAFRFVDRNDGEQIEHTGAYLEIVRPRRLVFTLSSPHQSHAITRVFVEVAPLKGGTGGAGTHHALEVEGARILVTHEDVPREYASRIESRWTGILYGLGVCLNSSPHTPQWSS